MERHLCVCVCVCVCGCVGVRACVCVVGSRARASSPGSRVSAEIEEDAKDRQTEPETLAVVMAAC